MEEQTRHREAIAALGRGEAAGEICTRLDRTRQWLAKWRWRFAAEGEAALRGRSRAPKRRPRSPPERIVRAVLAARDRLRSQFSEELRVRLPHTNRILSALVVPLLLERMAARGPRPAVRRRRGEKVAILSALRAKPDGPARLFGGQLEVSERSVHLHRRKVRSTSLLSEYRTSPPQEANSLQVRERVMELVRIRLIEEVPLGERSDCVAQGGETRVTPAQLIGEVRARHRTTVGAGTLDCPGLNAKPPRARHSP